MQQNRSGSRKKELTVNHCHSGRIPGPGVQRACNTGFESHLPYQGRLDKNPISPEVTGVGVAQVDVFEIARFCTGAG
jgi:hypothetical protein